MAAPKRHVGRYDEGALRRSKRTGRERGAWVYVPAAELEAAGIDPSGPPPLYRVWGRPRGSVMLRLYKQPPLPSSDPEEM